MLGAANPVSVRLLQDLGLTTFNTPTDLSLAQLAAIRAATTMPLDIYVEVPDDIGGLHPSLRDRRAGASLRAGLSQVRSAQRSEYLSGRNTSRIDGIALTRERLRRARIGFDMLNRLDPNTVMSPLPEAIA